MPMPRLPYSGVGPPAGLATRLAHGVLAAAACCAAFNAYERRVGSWSFSMGGSGPPSLGDLLELFQLAQCKGAAPGARLGSGTMDAAGCAAAMAELARGDGGINANGDEWVLTTAIGGSSLGPLNAAELSQLWPRFLSARRALGSGRGSVRQRDECVTFFEFVLALNALMGGVSSSSSSSSARSRSRNSDSPIVQDLLDSAVRKVVAAARRAGERRRERRFGRARRLALNLTHRLARALSAARAALVHHYHYHQLSAQQQPNSHSHSQHQTSPRRAAAAAAAAAAATAATVGGTHALRRIRSFTRKVPGAAPLTAAVGTAARSLPVRRALASASAVSSSAQRQLAQLQQSALASPVGASVRPRQNGELLRCQHLRFACRWLLFSAATHTDPELLATRPLLPAGSRDYVCYQGHGSAQTIEHVRRRVAAGGCSEDRRVLRCRAREGERAAARRAATR